MVGEVHSSVVGSWLRRGLVSFFKYVPGSIVDEQLKKQERIAKVGSVLYGPIFLDGNPEYHSDASYTNAKQTVCVHVQPRLSQCANAFASSQLRLPSPICIHPAMGQTCSVKCTDAFVIPCSTASLMTKHFVYKVIVLLGYCESLGGLRGQ